MFIEKLKEKEIKDFVKLLKYDDENLAFNYHSFNEIKFSDGGVYVNFSPLIDNFNAGDVELFISDFNITGNAGFVYETKAKSVLKKYLSSKFGNEYINAYNKFNQNEIVK